MLPDGTNGTEGAPDAQDSSLIDTILGTSGAEAPETTGQAGATSQTQGAEAAQAFKFAGREWKGGQTEAEKWANKLYGEFSKTQGTMKELKQLLQSSPEAVEALAQDPQWAQLLGKLGIEAAREEAQEQEAQEGEGQQEDYQSLRHEIRLERERLAIDREEALFEKRLGRSLSDDEHNTIMGIIQKASSLTMEEAYKLAYHDRLMQEAAKKAGQNARPGGNRPKPLPFRVPGTKTEAGKRPVDMGESEFREHLKGTQEFQNLVSRDG